MIRRLLPALLLAALALPETGAFASADGPVARTRGLIAAFEAVPLREEVRTAADRATNQRAFAVLDGYLDLTSLTEAPIRSHWTAFTDDQRATFLAGFRDLIRRVAYPDSGAFFRSAEVDIGTPRDAGDGVIIVPLQARLADEGLETAVGLHWKARDGVLRLIDVSFDGDSLVTDYRNQFARILAKEGAEGLIERLERKRAEIPAP